MIEALAAILLSPFFLLMLVAVAFASDLVLAWPLKWAWNYVLPALFGLPHIGYWHAFCLLVVSGLLIKSHASANSTGGKCAIK